MKVKETSFLGLVRILTTKSWFLLQKTNLWKMDRYFRIDYSHKNVDFSGDSLIKKKNSCVSGICLVSLFYTKSGNYIYVCMCVHTNTCTYTYIHKYIQADRQTHAHMHCPHLQMVFAQPSASSRWYFSTVKSFGACQFIVHVHPQY